MYVPMTGMVSGTFTLALAPGAIALWSCAAAPCDTLTAPLLRSLYETAVPAGIEVTPRFVTQTETGIGRPGAPALPSCRSAYGSGVEPRSAPALASPRDRAR